MKAINRKRIFAYLQDRLETSLHDRYPHYEPIDDFVTGYDAEKGFFVGLHFMHNNTEWYLESELHDDEARELIATDFTTKATEIQRVDAS